MTQFTFDFSANNAELSAFESQLASELESITNRALSQWVAASDSAFQSALRND